MVKKNVDCWKTKTQVVKSPSFVLKIRGENPWHIWKLWGYLNHNYLLDMTVSGGLVYHTMKTRECTMDKNKVFWSNPAHGAFLLLLYALFACSLMIKIKPIMFYNDRHYDPNREKLLLITQPRCSRFCSSEKMKIKTSLHLFLISQAMGRH